MKSGIFLAGITVSLMCSLFIISPAMGHDMQAIQVNTKQISDLNSRIYKLEQIITQMQQQIVLLQGAIKITGNDVEISSRGNIKLKASGDIELTSSGSHMLRAGMNQTFNSGMKTDIISGMNTTVRSGANTEINSGSGFKITSSLGEISTSAGLNLKGPLVRFNGGTKPIATVGSTITVNGTTGQISTGSATILGE